MSILSWMRARVCDIPLPAPEKLPDQTVQIPRDEHNRISADAIQAKMDSVFDENSRAAMSSLAVSQTAITAEERSRSILDELMREMDRGQARGKS
jgi:hypothetical protein